MFKFTSDTFFVAILACCSALQNVSPAVEKQTLYSNSAVAPQSDRYTAAQMPVDTQLNLAAQQQVVSKVALQPPQIQQPSQNYLAAIQLQNLAQMAQPYVAAAAQPSSSWYSVPQYAVKQQSYTPQYYPQQQYLPQQYPQQQYPQQQYPTSSNPLNNFFSSVRYPQDQGSGGGWGFPQLGSFGGGNFPDPSQFPGFGSGGFGSFPGLPAQLPGQFAPGAYPPSQYPIGSQLPFGQGGNAPIGSGPGTPDAVVTTSSSADSASDDHYIDSRYKPEKLESGEATSQEARKSEAQAQQAQQFILVPQSPYVNQFAGVQKERDALQMRNPAVAAYLIGRVQPQQLPTQFYSQQGVSQQYAPQLIVPQQLLRQASIPQYIQAALPQVQKPIEGANVNVPDVASLAYQRFLLQSKQRSEEPSLKSNFKTDDYAQRHKELATPANINSSSVGINSSSSPGMKSSASDSQSTAEAAPNAVALAGSGGVAGASPHGTAVVGKNGMASSAPRATAVAGASEDESEPSAKPASKREPHSQIYIAKYTPERGYHITKANF